jgi:hypothetical protein
LKREEKNEVVMLNRRSVILLARANLAFAVLASLAPLAHLLELPNKLTLNGPIWLAVQQHLYRGWGPFLGGPAEIGALITTLGLLAIHWHDRRIRRFLLVAAIVYAGMIAVFFVFNNPVNQAVNTWTATTLPANWSRYRLRWETGHAIAAGLAMIGLIVVGRSHTFDRRS